MGTVATARPCGSRTRASLARPWRPPASRRARVGQRRRLPVPAANAEALHLRARARTLTFHGFTLSLRFRYGPTYRLGGLLGAAAVELYRIERGTPPERLDDLGAVSGVRDPMSRDTLRYRRDTGGYVVYSVASDGTDDGGDFGALSPYSVWWQVAPDQSPDWGIRIRLPVEAGAP